MILTYQDFLLEEAFLGSDFTPLYHITYALPEILKDDELKIGRPSRGPRGTSVSRSRYYTHGTSSKMSHGGFPRLILNRELLTKDGYQSHPIDEWSLKKPEGGFMSQNPKWVIKKPWSDPDMIKKFKGRTHFGKSQFPNLVSGKRPISHNITGLTTDKTRGLEVEYEERILKNVKNLGKYIYAINLYDDNQVERYSEEIREYLKKYPKIKVLLGNDFKETSISL